MNRKTILLMIIICAIIIGVTYLFVYQFSGRRIYVHEFENTLPPSSEFYNLTADDLERFPFLLKSIQDDSKVQISEEEYNEFIHFLDEPIYVIWDNRYYKVYLDELQAVNGNVLTMTRWIWVYEFNTTSPICSECINMTAEDMEIFPFLLESIQKDDYVHISEEDYNELWNFLGDILNIKWNNRYYDVQLGMS